MSVPDTDRRSSTLRFALKLALVLLAVVVAIYLVLLADLQRALSRRLDKLHAAGVPKTWREAAPPRVPDADNAAILYLQAFGQLDSAMMSGTSDRDCLTRFNSDNPPGSRRELRADVRRILGRNRAALELVRQAASRPRCRFPLEWPQSPADLTFPHFVHLRACARLLAADAFLAAEKGETARAVGSYRAGFRMSAHIASETYVVAFLTSTSIQAIMLKTLPDALARARLDAADCRALCDELGRLEFDTPFRQSIATEGCEVLWYFDAADRQPAEVRGLFRGDSGQPDLLPPMMVNLYLSPMGRLVRLKEEIAYADFLGEFLALSTRPYRSAAPQYRAADGWAHQVPSYYFVAQFLAPVSARLVISRDRAIALRNAMQVALALEAYHTTRGAYPDSLDALREYPGWTLHEDPFSGKPFVYHRQGAGFVLYSYGGDLDDDSGQPYDWQAENGDLVWECKS